MTEVESEVLKSYQAALATVSDLEQGLVQPLIEELSNEVPNAELLADIIKLKKKTP